jgi:hypothetical protein
LVVCLEIASISACVNTPETGPATNASAELLQISASPSSGSTS